MPLVKELRIIGKNDDVRELFVVCNVCMYVLIVMFASFVHIQYDHIVDNPRFN